VVPRAERLSRIEQTGGGDAIAVPGPCVMASSRSGRGVPGNDGPVSVSKCSDVGASSAPTGGGVMTPAATRGVCDALQATHRVAPGAKSALHRGHFIMDMTYYRCTSDLNRTSRVEGRSPRPTERVERRASVEAIRISHHLYQR